VTRVLLVLALLAAPAHAEEVKPWYRGFYTRVGVRDTYGFQEPFHAWAALSFGLGYRFNRDCWGVDLLLANIQFDPEEGMHTLAKITGYQGLRHWTVIDLWVGGGLSYGWVKGTVDQAIPKRRGEGWQAEAVVGIELPRSIKLRTFVQATLTLPIFELRDTTYMARDSTINVWALEAAYGIRF
jgi:hypothetical protein